MNNFNTNQIPRPQAKQPIPPYAKLVFKGIIFDVYQWEQQLYDGATATFEAVKRPDTVNVLPITHEGEIILTKQSQPGEENFIGAIGGRVDPGEDPLVAAHRELKEETGFVDAAIKLWFVNQLVPKIDCASFSFIATNWQESHNTNHEGGEKIELIKVGFNGFVNELIYQDNFRDFDIAFKIMKAKQNPIEFAALQKLFLS